MSAGGTQIALRIQVGSLAGAQRGVPRLLEALQTAGAGATFCLSLGPDRSGRARGEALRLARRAGWSSLLRGTLLPAGEIGRQAADSLKLIPTAACEAGLSAWDRVTWEKHGKHADNAAIATDLARGCAAFTALFGTPPRIFAAPAWQAHRQALRLLQRLGFAGASDCRGTAPFLPVWDGEPLPCPQLPTTLPTLEDLAHAGSDATAALAQLLEAGTRLQGPQVFALRAEYEGLGDLDPLVRLWQGWRAQGHALITLGELASACSPARLPYARIAYGQLPHRPNPLALQGEPFLA
jgi:peptidoglycan/xylan/chitin deacetylase (PgdA/CDA1 family)